MARQTDPGIAARIDDALDDARSVLNIGAGTGSYEPIGRAVTAVEPSAEMIAQRPEKLAQAIQVRVEELPFEDGSFDAAMTLLSDHHWSDRARGLSEMRRVARRRVLLLNADPGAAERFWLTRDYLPGLLSLIPDPYRRPGYWEQELRDQLGPIEVQTVPVRYDCHDGFYQAYWRRPHAYLDPAVRAAISVFHRLPAAEVSAAIDRLRRDLAGGTWERRNADLLSRAEFDVGLRLVVAELDGTR